MSTHSYHLGSINQEVKDPGLSCTEVPGPQYEGTMVDYGRCVLLLIGSDGKKTVYHVFQRMGWDGLGEEKMESLSSCLKHFTTEVSVTGRE